jgi:hypothetical protein
MQPDGTLVRSQRGAAYWSTHTTTGKTALMQTAGNFVLYDAAGHAVWYTDFGGHPGAHLSVQSDGNLVVYSSTGGVVWNTGTIVSGLSAFSRDWSSVLSQMQADMPAALQIAKANGLTVTLFGNPFADDAWAASFADATTHSPVASMSQKPALKEWACTGSTCGNRFDVCETSSSSANSTEVQVGMVGGRSTDHLRPQPGGYNVKFVDVPSSLLSEFQNAWNAGLAPVNASLKTLGASAPQFNGATTPNGTRADITVQCGHWGAASKFGATTRLLVTAALAADSALITVNCDNAGIMGSPSTLANILGHEAGAHTLGLADD